MATDSNIRYGCSPVCRISADQLTIWSPALLLSLTYPLQRSVLLCVHIVHICRHCTHLYTLHIYTLCSFNTLCSCVSDHRAEHDKGGGHHWDHETSDRNSSGTKCRRMLLKQVESKQVAVAFVHLRASTNTLSIPRSRGAARGWESH